MLLLRCSQLRKRGAVSGWLLCPFDLSTLLCFEDFLTFWFSKMFQAHFIDFLPQR